MKHKIIVFVMFGLIVNYCQAQRAQKKISGNYAKESECIKVEMDGSQTIKSWGFGNGRLDAIEQAKKNSVRDVLFKGIRNGQQECNQKPIINEVNAQEKYEDYFNKFFADEGLYKIFISMKDEPLKTYAKKRQSAKNGVQYEAIVTIDRAKLKNQMITDKILIP